MELCWSLLFVVLVGFADGGDVTLEGEGEGRVGTGRLVRVG